MTDIIPMAEIDQIDHRVVSVADHMAEIDRRFVSRGITSHQQANNQGIV
jgi:hypothetical protein